MVQFYKIGQYVEGSLKEKCLSIQDLSNVLNCSELDVKRFLKGRVIPTYSQLFNIANFLEVPIMELLKGDRISPEKEKIIDLINNYMDILDSIR